MIISYPEINDLVLPLIIQGIVVNKKDNSPVGFTHVYFEKGEEESLTTTEGEFKIISCQKFPVTLIVKNIHFKTVRLVVTSASQRILIFLNEK